MTKPNLSTKIFNPFAEVVKIVKAIEARPTSPAKFYYLCWSGQCYLCIPAGLIPPPTHNLGKFLESTLIKGFNSKQWEKIQDGIVDLHKRGII